MAKTTDAREKELIKTRTTEFILQRKAATEEAYGKAVEESMKRIQAAGNIERQRLDVNRQILEIQKEALQATGASFGTLWNMQQEIVKTKGQELAITKQQRRDMEKGLEDVIRRLGGNSDEAKKYQKELQDMRLREAKETADLMKAAIGQQRDFLDKALQKAFGGPGNSRWQPAVSDRMLFGQHTQLGGMNFAGQVDPRLQQQQAIAAAQAGLGNGNAARAPGGNAPGRAVPGGRGPGGPRPGGIPGPPPAMGVPGPPPLAPPGPPGGGPVAPPGVDPFRPGGPGVPGLPAPGIPGAPGPGGDPLVVARDSLGVLKDIRTAVIKSAEKAGVVGLPALAGGGIVKSRTFAEIGEAGAEAVIPLDQLGAMMGDMSGGNNTIRGGTGVSSEFSTLARTTSDIYALMQENMGANGLASRGSKESQTTSAGEGTSDVQQYDLSGKIQITLSWDREGFKAMIEDEMKLLVKRGYVMAGPQWRGTSA
jgi:hypothetical protein